MRILIAAAFVLALPGIVFAQLQVDTLKYKEHSDRYGKSEQVLPKVRSADVKLAKRINIILGSDGSDGADTGDRVTNDDDAGLFNHGFEVIRNDDRVLSIRFDQLGCAAYCEEFRSYTSFDARNGRVLALDDLLTPSGITVIARQLAAQRKALYRHAVAGLKSELRAAKRGKAGDDSDLKERLELNEACLARASETKPDNDAEWLKTLDYVKYWFDDKAIVLEAGRCSNHAQLALDDVSDIELSIDNAKLAQYLTPYGRYLQLGGDAVPMPKKPFGQVLFGKLGGVPITLSLDQLRYGGVSAWYYYDKYRVPIVLSGLVNDNGLELTERIGEGDQAVMRLRRSGLHLKGVWEGKGKNLPVELDW